MGAHTASFFLLVAMVAIVVTISVLVAGAVVAALARAQRRQHRERRPRLFQIGFNRAGTTTLAHFFRRHGLRVVHNANGTLAQSMRRNRAANRPLLADRRFTAYDVYTDMEAAFPNEEPYLAHVTLYRELDRQYPGSRFILNVRDVEGWIRSRMQHRHPTYGGYAERHMAAWRVNRTQLAQRWRGQWQRHVADVKNYFRNRPDDLLVFDIEHDRPQRLADFAAPLFRHVRWNLAHYGHLNRSATSGKKDQGNNNDCQR